MWGRRRRSHALSECPISDTSVGSPAQKLSESLYFRDLMEASSLRCVFVLATQSCPTLCDLMDCSPPGSSVHGVFQTRILEWVASSFSWDLPDPGMEPGSVALQTISLPTEPLGKPLRQDQSLIPFSAFIPSQENGG